MSDAAPERIPTVDDVKDAARRLAGNAVVTPLLENEALSAAIGGRLLVKAECLQRTGSFKFRGAYNRISRISEPDRARGVIAFSSGNHAQAVAAVARLFGIPATIVMPADAPRIKLAATRAHGADVVTYDRTTEDREAIARALMDRTGATLVPPFDDPLVVAGQGIAGLEIAAQAKAMAARPDLVLVPCSGGGLVAGIATAIKAEWPDVEVRAVEPAGYDDTARSLAADRIVTNDPAPPSLCDALLVPSPGRLTFAANRRLLAGGVALSDDAALSAMAAAFRHLKLVLEPGGAIALAAALTGAVPCNGRTIAVVASGGNVDPGVFSRALALVTD